MLTQNSALSLGFLDEETVNASPKCPNLNRISRLKNHPICIIRAPLVDRYDEFLPGFVELLDALLVQIDQSSSEL